MSQVDRNIAVPTTTTSKAKTIMRDMFLIAK